MTDYYVSTTGNNENPGTDALPFRTIQWAVNKMYPGDTTYVKNGSYYEKISFPRSGQSGSLITLKNYTGHSPVIDGRAGVDGINSGLPTGDPNKFSPSGKGGKENGLFDISAKSYIHVEGLKIYRSMGKGLRVFKGSSNITITDVTVSTSRRHNVLVEGSSYVTFDNLTSYYSGEYYDTNRASGAATDWASGFAVNRSTYVTLKNSKIYRCWGESIEIDTNFGSSSNITVQDTQIVNNFKGALIQACQDLVFTRNLVWQTSDYNYAGVTPMGIQLEQAEKKEWRIVTENIDITNNIIVGMLGPGIRVAGGGQREIIQNCTIAYNLILGCAAGLVANAPIKANMVFKNNIVRNCTTKMTDLNGGTRFATNWTSDYNNFSSTPGVPYAGANDVYGDPLLVDEDYRPTESSFDTTKYRLQNASPVIAQATPIAGITTDYYQAVRDVTTPDIGPHENGGSAPTPPTATAGGSPTSGEYDLAVSFTGSASGGTSPYTYAWDFGDGIGTSTSQNPSYTYKSAGQFTATLTVTDANDLTDDDTQVITVQTQGTGGTAIPLEKDVVKFAASAATFAVTSLPKLILFYGSSAVSDATFTDDAMFCTGYVDLINNKQYAMSIRSDDGRSTTTVCGEQGFSEGKAIVLIDGEGRETASAVVDVENVTSTSVPLTWTGTTSSEAFVAVCLGGNAIEDVKAAEWQLYLKDSTSTISGDYNLAICNFLGRSLDENIGISQLSLGMAKRGALQGCISYMNRDLRTTGAEVKGRAHDERLGYCAREGYSISVSSWTPAGITATPPDKNFLTTTKIPVLLVKVASTVDFEVEFAQLPAATGNTDYALHGWTSTGLILGYNSTLPNRYTNFDNSYAGVLGVTVADDTPTARSIVISSEDSAWPTVEQSYTDNNWSLPASDGTLVGQGTISMISGGWRIACPTTVPSEQYESLWLSFETVSGLTGPTADFFYYSVTGTQYYDDTISFNGATSKDDGTYSITNYDWDWGDGTAGGTGATPTHVYTQQGVYTVRLTVTDSNAATDYIEKEITITPPLPTVYFDWSPYSGAIPLTVTLDGTASNAGGDEEVVYKWTVTNSDDPEQKYEFYGQSTTVELIYQAEWDITLEATNINDPSIYAERTEYRAVETLSTLSVDFYGEYGKVTLIGPVTIDFTALATEDGTYTWEWGDGDPDDVGLNLTSTSHTYAAVGTKTAYDVALTVLTADETATETETKVGYITIVPTPTAPRTIAQMITRIEALEDEVATIREHLGHLDDATWTQHATYKNVYQTTVSRIWTSGMTITVLEDDVALSSQVSVANVQSNQGSFYYTFASPNLTLYVHTTDSDHAGENNSVYRMKFS